VLESKIKTEFEFSMELDIRLITGMHLVLGNTRTPAKPGSPVTKFVAILASNAPNRRTERLKKMLDRHCR
jgi:hypothetical protein